MNIRETIYYNIPDSEIFNLCSIYDRIKDFHSNCDCACEGVEELTEKQLKYLSGILIEFESLIDRMEELRVTE